MLYGFSDFCSNDFAADNCRWYARTRHCQLTCVPEIIQFPVFERRLQEGGLQQRIGQSVSIALESMVVAHEIGMCERALIDDGIPDRLADDVLETVHYQIEVAFPDLGCILQSGCHRNQDKQILTAFRSYRSVGN